MRAPDRPRRRLTAEPLTDPEWLAIKQNAAVGFDADTVLAHVGMSLGEMSLRAALPFIAAGCEIASSDQKGWDTRTARYNASITLQALAKEHARSIELCRELLARLGDGEPDGDLGKHNRRASLGEPCGDDPKHWLQFPRLPSWERRARAVLQEGIAELERARAEAAAMGGRGKGNRKPHVRFWDKLWRIWLDNVDADVPWMVSNHFADFLIACSQPFFPEDTTDIAVTGFIKGLKRPSRK
jgi:hypothetical protein